MKWNKINALNMRTLSRSQQGAPERCRCLCSTSVTVNKMVASWGLVDDFDDEVVTTSSRLRLLDVDLQLCNAAFGLTRWARWARWDQMGPDGTRDRPWRPWALEKMTQHLWVCKKIESFSSKRNRDHPDTNPMSFLLLFLALDDQVNLCESESSEYICLNKKQPQTGERLNTCAHVNTWRRYSICRFRVWSECSCLQLIKCATWDAATSSVEKTKSQSHAEHWQHMNSSTNVAICCRVMFMSFT